MPAVYERVDHTGTVVERVQPVPGDYEDTRLGVAVIEGGQGWRLAGQQDTQPAEIESTQVTATDTVDAPPDVEPVPQPAKARKEK